MRPHAVKPVGSTHMLGCEWANGNAQTLLFAHGRFKRRFRRFLIAAQATNPAVASSARRKNPALYTAIEDAPAVPSSTEENLSPQTSNRMPISPNTLRKPELLAPAGGWPQLHAAIENGADAVYFGVSTLNARARACNFEPEELPKVMAYLHERGASGYLALNILIFDEELLQVAQLAQQAAAAGVDAVIVQDLGVVELIKAAAPGLAIHGSTQMTITSPEGAAFAGSLGIERVVVGRELSIKDIDFFQRYAPPIDDANPLPENNNSPTPHEQPPQLPEVEAFVHGAMCVSLSGQCLDSEKKSGRSANRGQCAQTCRLDYGLLVDGELQTLGDVQYLLSPQDLAAVELVPQLIHAGVVSFKIEGRLKGPEYVAMTTQTYRKAIDKAWETMTSIAQGGRAASDPLSASTAARLEEQEWRELRQVFARGQDADHLGLSPGFLLGSKHQELVRGRAPRHRGVFLGETVEVLDASKRHPQQAVYGRKRENGPKRSQHRVMNRSNKHYASDTDSNSRYKPAYKTVAERSRSFSHQPLGDSDASLGVVVRLSAPVRRGDGVVFDSGNPRSEEAGGSIYEIFALHSQNSKNSSTTTTIKGTKYHRRSVEEAQPGELVELRFGAGQLDLDHVSIGDLIWKNKDPVLDARLRDSYQNVSAAQRRRVPVTVRVRAGVGKPMEICIEDEAGRQGIAHTEISAQAATARPLTAGAIEKALGIHLGDEGSLVVSRFDFSECEFGGGEESSAMGMFFPAAAIKDARRHAVAALLAKQRSTAVVPWETMPSASAACEGLLAKAAGEGHKWMMQTMKSCLDATVAGVPTSSSIAAQGIRRGDDGAATPSNGLATMGVDETLADDSKGADDCLRVLCRTPGQAHAAAEIPWVKEIVLDFLEVQGIKESCEVVRKAGKRVVVATPRVLKPDERKLWLFYLKVGADALLVRSAGLLHHFMQLGGPGTIIPGCGDNPIPRLEGDFSLNATNVLSTTLLLSRGLDRLAPAHDCNAAQLVTLAHGLGDCSKALEAIIHTNLPVFHTEHCVFARFLSNGNSFLDCGHPCERHTVHLKAPDGQDHLVLADMGCRNTVFAAQAQSALPFLKALVRSGFGMYRIELVDQPATVVKPLLEAYGEALQDEMGHAGMPRGTATAAGMDGTARQGDTWQWLQGMPDANGRAHGVGMGSLGIREERSREEMKPTAASLRGAASNVFGGR